MTASPGKDRAGVDAEAARRSSLQKTGVRNEQKMRAEVIFIIVFMKLLQQRK